MWTLSQFRCYREKYNGAYIVGLRGQKKDEEEERHESSGGNYTQAH